MGQKKNKEDNIKRDTKFLENKIQGIQRIIDELENNIVDLEVEMSVGKRDKNLLQKIIFKMESELQNQQKNYEDFESQIENMGKEKNWLDWVSKFGETIKFDTSSEKKQKEFINGLVDKVVVYGDIGEVRNQVKQVGHTLEIYYKMNVVDDKLI
jgi:chromosome segregation ATPase